MLRGVIGLVFLLMLIAHADAGEVRLSAAASLKDALDALSDSFARENPGVTLLKNYGASGVLAKQIENGAPTDIFISANLEWMDYLKGKGVVDAARVAPFASNTLVFVGASGKGVTSMQDLPKLERIAIGSPRSVPAGEYAMEAFRKSGVDRLLARKLVMAKDVRECLMYAERGEVDGAFVYGSDALQAKRARILFTVPNELHARITYPVGMTVRGGKKSDALAFYRFLLSGEARAILIKNGFAAP